MQNKLAGLPKLIVVLLTANAVLAFHSGVLVRPMQRRLPAKNVLSDDGRVDLVALQKIEEETEGVEVLSKEPLVYSVKGVLSASECDAYINYALQQEEKGRPMTRSNPPEVSLDGSKLWPLPFLSLGAGVPPVVRAIQSTGPFELSDALQSAAPNVFGALFASIVLAYGVALPLMRQVSQLSARTSSAVALNEESDVAFVKAFVDRISIRTCHDWSRWEAPVVTQYDPGAVFARHGDASPIQGQEWIGKGGQRLVTCICYLNTVNDGGETYFDKLDIAVKPEAGKALIFFPADGTSWKADGRTTHESKPPVSNEKWIVQMFGRAQRVPPPLGLPDVYASFG